MAERLRTARRGSLSVDFGVDHWCIGIRTVRKRPIGLELRCILAIVVAGFRGKLVVNRRALSGSFRAAPDGEDQDQTERTHPR